MGSKFVTALLPAFSLINWACRVLACFACTVVVK